jgi:hypothetical protein
MLATVPMQGECRDRGQTDLCALPRGKAGNPRMGGVAASIRCTIGAFTRGLPSHHLVERWEGLCEVDDALNGGLAFDLSLDAIPQHKRTWRRPIEGDRPSHHPDLETITGATMVFEPTRVVRTWTVARRTGGGG